MPILVCVLKTMVENVEPKCEKFGFRPAFISDLSLSAKGVGEAKTSKVDQLPIGFKLKQTGLLIPAAMQGY